MFLTGSVLCVGGMVSSLVMSRELSWFLFIPYIADFTEAMFLELTLLLMCLFLIVASIGSGVHYYRTRIWYLIEQTKARDATKNEKLQQMQFGKLNYAAAVQTAQKRTKTN